MQPWERTFLLSASELQTWLKVHSWFCGKLHRILGSRQFVFFLYSFVIRRGMFPIFPTKPNILKISIFPSSCSGSILHYSMASWLIMGSYIALHRPACSDVCVALQGICPAGGRKPEVPWWHMAQIANIGLSDLSIGQRTQDKVGQLKFSSSLSLCDDSKSSYKLWCISMPRKSLALIASSFHGSDRALSGASLGIFNALKSSFTTWFPWFCSTIIQNPRIITRRFTSK